MVVLLLLLRRDNRRGFASGEGGVPFMTSGLLNNSKRKKQFQSNKREKKAVGQSHGQFPIAGYIYDYQTDGRKKKGGPPSY